jgi:DNA-binding MarR family transcriptional regulator
VDDPMRDSPLGEDVSFLLARANSLSVAAGDAALAAYGLKVRSFSVLALAASGHGLSQRDLSAFLRLDPSRVVALVDDLQSRGLVERRPDPADRRANLVVATPDGRTLCARARRATVAAEQRLHAGLTEQERAAFADVLRRIAYTDRD